MSDGPSDDEFVEINLVPAPDEPEGDGEPEAEKEGDAAEGEGAEGSEGEHESGEGDEGSEGDDEGLPEDRKPAKGAEARIAELTRLRREAERQRDAAIAQLQGARDPAKAATPKPVADDFEDYGDYVEALTDWKADQRDAERADTNATTAAERAAQHRNAEWSAKIGAAKSIMPDFDAVMEKADTPTAPHVADALMDADRGPELLYHLANNPDVVERLNDMSPARAAIELGKIEAKLEAPEAAPPPPPRKTTTAPAPITPVKTGATTAKDPAKMNMEEYKAYRAAQGITR